MIQINNKISIPASEVELSAVRSQGPGGQHVNKAATAIHLRFDVAASSLPDDLKARLLQYNDHRITKEGLVVIKAQQHRSQDKNRKEALARLRELIRTATRKPKKRKPTKPTLGAKKKRLQRKKRHGEKKARRKKVDWDS